MKPQRLLDLMDVLQGSIGAAGSVQRSMEPLVSEHEFVSSLSRGIERERRGSLCRVGIVERRNGPMNDHGTSRPPLDQSVGRYPCP